MQNLTNEIQDAEHVEFAQTASYSLLNRKVSYGWQKSQVERKHSHQLLNGFEVDVVLPVEGTCSCVAYKCDDRVV